MLDYTKADWTKRASGLTLRHQAFIGGKSPNLVFADCDNLDAAADMAAFGIFFN